MSGDPTLVPKREFAGLATDEQIGRTANALNAKIFMQLLPGTAWRQNGYSLN
jgi:hypothetical protein